MNSWYSGQSGPLNSNSWLTRLFTVQPPRRWTKDYCNTIIQRANRRIRNLEERTTDLSNGRTMPDLDQVAIGSGKHFQLAILFLDICNFSSWPSADASEQLTVLRIMDVFMAEMLNVIRDFGGVFEKNTGDGLMAYFGTETSDGSSSVRSAVEAATVMHAVNDLMMNPWLQKQNLWPIRFRIGIDYGQVTIGKVGVPGGMNSFVAIGTPANIACKLMRHIPNGGICLGNEVYRQLPAGWDAWCTLIPGPSGFIYKWSQKPYPAWQLDYRLSLPIF